MIQYSFLTEDINNLQIKNLLKDKKIKNIAIGAGALKALSFSTISSIVTTKIIKIRKLIRKCETREEAERILLNVGYIIKDDGNKDVRLASINYAISDAVCGPSLQIVNNETDPLWKEHVLKYLKVMAASNALKSIIGIAGSVAAINALRK